MVYKSITLDFLFSVTLVPNTHVFHYLKELGEGGVSKLVSCISFFSMSAGLNFLRVIFSLLFFRTLQL